MEVFKENNIPNPFFHEVEVLRKFTHNNFIQKLISSFHDYDNLYFVSKFYDSFVLNYMTGDWHWNEKQIQFYSACLIQSLIDLRKEKYIHRDIHFGNLVMDSKKYISLIDFHITIEYINKNNHHYDIVGSPELCAPEMVNLKTYDYNSDYYRLGSMIYFIIFKNYPNYIRRDKNITNIFVRHNETKEYSAECIDFLNRLIVTEKQNRIGFNNINELVNHPFFKNFNWNDLIHKKMKSPFIDANETKRNLGLCAKPFNFTKRIFFTPELLKIDRVRNIFINFDNVNNEITNNIYNKFNLNTI